MAFVNAETLRRIFGGAPVMQQGAFDPSTPQGQQMIATLAGAGSGMTQASAQPGANFAQALGGGAAGMMQGQHQHQQRQYMQQQIELQRQKMEEQRQRAKGWQEILYGPQGDFASQVDTGGVPSQQTALSGATITPEAQRGAVTAQQMPPQDVPIGTLGSMFESNGRADAINTGQGDPGGPSYGRYQLASRTGTLNSFFESDEGQPFRAQFGDLEPGTPQFDQVWREVAGDPQVGPLFDQAQQQYMERTHFRPNLERAQRSGFDVSNPGVREAVVSMGTQHSPAGNLRIFNEAAARIGPDATPQQMVDALYEARTNYVRNLPEGEGRMSPDVKAGVLSRYERERAAAQQLTQVGLPQPAQQVLGGQQTPQQVPQIERSGYGQAGGGGLNIPEEVRPLLALLGPEKGAQLLAQQAFASPADQPADVRTAQVIAQSLGRDPGDVLAEIKGIGPYAGQEGGPTTAVQTIMQTAELLRVADPSLSIEDSLNAALGRYQLRQHGITQEVGRFDTLTGNQAGQGGEQPGLSLSPEEERLLGQGREQTPDAAAAFGGGAVFRNFMNTLSDVTGGELPFPATEAAGARMRTLGTRSQILLTEQFAGRVSNQLLDMVNELNTSPMSVFQGPGRGRQRLEEMQRLITEDIARNIETANDSSRGGALRREARDVVPRLRQFNEALSDVLDIYGTTDPWSGQSVTGQEPVRLPSNDAEADRMYETLSSGDLYIGPDGVLREKP